MNKLKHFDFSLIIIFFALQFFIGIHSIYAQTSEGNLELPLFGKINHFQLNDSYNEYGELFVEEENKSLIPGMNSNYVANHRIILYLDDLEIFKLLNYFSKNFQNFPKAQKNSFQNHNLSHVNFPKKSSLKKWINFLAQKFIENPPLRGIPRMIMNLQKEEDQWCWTRKFGSFNCDSTKFLDHFGGNTLRIFDTQNLTLLDKINLPNIYSADVSDDEKYLMLGFYDGKSRMFHISVKGKLEGFFSDEPFKMEMNSGENIELTKFLPSTSNIFIQTNQRMIVLDWKKNKIIMNLSDLGIDPITENDITKLYQNFGKLMTFQNSSKMAKFWDLKNGNLLHQFDCRDFDIYSDTIFPIDQREEVLITPEKGQVLLYNLDTKVISHHKVPQDEIKENKLKWKLDFKDSGQSFYDIYVMSKFDSFILFFIKYHHKSKKLENDKADFIFKIGNLKTGEIYKVLNMPFLNCDIPFKSFIFPDGDKFLFSSCKGKINAYSICFWGGLNKSQNLQVAEKSSSCVLQ
jgi:hypothetical protein